MVQKNKVTPVILAGGSGTRLWPLSRKSYPKQFSKLVGDNSLFQQTALRLHACDSIAFDAPITMTNADFRFVITEQLQAVGIDPGAILIEPEGKNTAPAILAACLFALEQEDDPILLICPSDHLIPDHVSFHDALLKGIQAIQDGSLVTFGIEPVRAETGYGYLELGGETEKGVFALNRFVEKPDREAAERMYGSGKFFWNAGIFLMRAKDMVTAFTAHCPHLIAPVSAAMQAATSDLGFLRIDPEQWKKCDDISIDYAVMEKAENLKTVGYAGAWSDLGDWHAIWSARRSSEQNVSISENTTALDCHNVLLRSEHHNLHLVGLGLKDIIAVAMPDAVLVMHKDYAQKVRDVVKTLKEKNIPQAELLPKDYRPWGWFETLVIDGRYQVKRIYVHPGGKLSLQSHNHRSEHWIIVEGEAQVTVDKKVTQLVEGQSVYVPQGAVHRLENLGEEAMILVEVQTGSYLGEDDIIRYEDAYART